MLCKKKFGKKGTALQYYFLILAFYIGLVAYTINAMNFTFDGFIGENSYRLLEAKQKGDEALLYLQLSSKLSAQQSIYDLAQKGGISFSPCGAYYGYSLWQEQQQDGSMQDCHPTKEEAKLTFQNMFAGELSNLLITHPHYSFPIEYDFDVNNALNISGFTTANVIIPINLPHSPLEHSIPLSIPSSTDLVQITAVSCSGMCLLTNQAYENLIRANIHAIQQGFELHVYSSYRPLQHQIDLWEGNTPEKYAQRYPNEAERRLYVCYPYGEDVYTRCPHLTGGAVDVRIRGKSSNNEMSTQEWNQVAQAMFQGGYVRYSNEVWHFEYGTDRWTRAQKQGATTIT